jgi:methylmalonyl-CoA/ethylmalonyl-CoA epimerase
MLNQIAHIAIVVSSFNKIDKWRTLFGVDLIEEEYTSNEQLVDAIILKTGNIVLEFLKPTSPKSPVYNFLQKNKMGGIHHICFEIEDLESSLKTIKDKNIRKITKGQSQTGIEKSKICFLNPLDFNGVLVELKEK